MTDDARPVPQEIKEGRSFPLGATLSADGANFSVYSKHATGIELLLFDSAEDDRPERVISIDPATNRTYHYWHVFVSGVKGGQIYAYRVRGPFDPASSRRCVQPHCGRQSRRPDPELSSRFSTVVLWNNCAASIRRIFLP